MKKFMIFLMTIAVIAAFAYASIFIFKVNSISYAGDLNYSDEDYTKWIFGEEEPNALVYKLFADKKKQVPFAQRYDVDIKWPNKMEVTIYEKVLVGYIDYRGSNMYFDKDGIVVESSSEIYSNVPQIDGLKFENIVLGEKIGYEGDQGLFTDILDLKQAIDKYSIKVDTIYFDSSNNVDLYIDQVKVEIGNPKDANDRLYALKQMQPKLSGLKGTLYLNKYNGQDSSVYFSKDE